MKSTHRPVTDICETGSNPATFDFVGDLPTSSRFYAGVGAVWLAYGYLLLQVACPGLGELSAWFWDRFRQE